VIKMYIGLRVKYPLFLSDYNLTCIFSTNYQKYSHVVFNENLSTGIWVVPYGQRDGQTWRS